MYLRETRRRNKDGSTVSYLQLAHNERHPLTGAPTAKVIHSFGRADSVDRGALARLVSSISRFLDPEAAVAAAAGADVQVLDCRRLGGAWVLDQLWTRLGIGAAIRRVAQARRVDGEVAERVIFALVAQRALEPGSKLAATEWVTERVFIEHLPTFSDDQAYRAMDFLLEALEEIAAEVFASVATLLNLQVDLVFVDTTSTYWHLDVPEELADVLREDEDRTAATSRRPRFRPRPAGGPLGIPRTTVRICRRWSSRWRSPATGCRSGAGPSRATPPTPASSAGSETIWPGGTCTGWCGWPTAGSPPPRTGPT